jgi:hypothetical protein
MAGIPTNADRSLSAIDDLHGVVLIRCRTFHFGGRLGDPQNIRQALQEYCDKVIEFVNADPR